MAKETQIGNLVIDLQIKTAALEKGLNAAKTKLKELEQENEQIKSSNKGVDASFVAMAAGIVASLAKIKSAVDDGIQKYNQYTNQMKALQKTSIATGNSFGEVKKAVEDVNSLKLMDESDVTTATKNLLTYGFTIEQTSDMLKVLQDAAVGYLFILPGSRLQASGRMMWRSRSAKRCTRTVLSKTVSLSSQARR